MVLVLVFFILLASLIIYLASKSLHKKVIRVRKENSILFVDDLSIQLAIWQDACEKEGIHLKSFGNTKDCLDFVKNNKDFAASVVVLDFFIDELNGSELAERLKKLQLPGPYVLCSSLGRMMPGLDHIIPKGKPEVVFEKFFQVTNHNLSARRISLILGAYKVTLDFGRICCQTFLEKGVLGPPVLGF